MPWGWIVVGLLMVCGLVLAGVAVRGAQDDPWDDINLYWEQPLPDDVWYCRGCGVEFGTMETSDRPLGHVPGCPVAQIWEVER